ASEVLASWQATDCGSASQTCVTTLVNAEPGPCRVPRGASSRPMTSLLSVGDLDRTRPRLPPTVTPPPAFWAGAVVPAIAWLAHRRPSRYRTPAMRTTFP